MRIDALWADGEQASSKAQLAPGDVVQLVKSASFAWVDIEIGHSSDSELTDLLVKRLDYHPATAEDCLEPTPYHQPKIDEEQQYKFITFLYYTSHHSELVTRELNLYCGESYVITVHRHPCPELLALLKALPLPIAEYRQRAVLFVHHVLDMLVDTFKQHLTELQVISDELEIRVLKGQRQHVLLVPPRRRREQQLSDMRVILGCRQSLVMLRRTLAGEHRIIESFISEFDYENAPDASVEIAIYFRDIADRINKFLEITESEERTLAHLMDVHSLITSYRTNEIVYILTIVSTILLPLNLVVGFFGMNFEHLWLIRHPLGVWMVVLLMLAVAGGLALYFRAKDWI